MTRRSAADTPAPPRLRLGVGAVLGGAEANGTCRHKNRRDLATRALKNMCTLGSCAHPAPAHPHCRHRLHTLLTRENPKHTSTRAQPTPHNAFLLGRYLLSTLHGIVKGMNV